MQREKKSQVQDPMETLRVYSSSAYRSNIKSTNPLFSDIEGPVLEEPEDPEAKITKDKKGVETKTISKFQEVVYNEKMKEWIKEKRV